jgi:hypothetical protein
MKNNETSFTYVVFIIVCALIFVILVIAVTEPAAGAQPINQREWLLEYEQVDDMGYPAPEPTATYEMGYPAPIEEPTATAKPKKKPRPTKQGLEPTAIVTQEPTPTKSLWDLFCEEHYDTNWCVDPSTRPNIDNPFNYRPTPAPTSPSFCDIYPANIWCVDG